MAEPLQAALLRALLSLFGGADLDPDEEIICHFRTSRTHYSSEFHFPAARLKQLEEQSAPLSQCSRDILRVLEETGHRLTTSGIRKALEARGLIHGESTVKTTLSSLVKNRVLTKDPEADPPGYAPG